VAAAGTLTPTQSRRAMNLNIALGSLGTMWSAVAAPGVVLNPFFMNHLGATGGQLGLLTAAIQVASVFNLLSIIVYARIGRVKAFWIATTMVQRLYSFVPAAVAFAAWRGAERASGVLAITIGVAIGWSLAHLSVSGWYTWVTSYVPEDTRATFFGRRSAVLNTVSVVWITAVTVLLDQFAGRTLYLAYFWIFLAAGAAGVADIALAVLIPEPRRPATGDAAGAKAEAAGAPAEPPGFSWRDFAEPVRNRNFLRFTLSIALFGFSTSVLSPFIAPYITAPDGIGAPNAWLGIMNAITQLAVAATATGWGMLADRFGRKPVVLLGALYPLAWAAYFFLTPNNYVFILPIAALAAGLLAPGINSGAEQLMLTLATARNRTAYVAWYVAIAGSVPAAGSVLGGKLRDLLQGLALPLGPITVGGFQVMTLVCFALVLATVLLLTRIREGREKPVAFVLAQLATPSIFRTFLNIGVLGRPEASDRVARALRTTEAASGAIALSDIVRRLDDPDAEVREEAAKALGRIGSTDAVDALLRHLTDPFSAIRPAAARALGRIGDPRAVEPLVASLTDRSDELLEACCQALGRMGVHEALGPLLGLLAEERSDRVAAAAGDAMSRLGAFEAALDLLPRMHATWSRGLRRQFAIALGNLLGKPGAFYPYLTGDRASRAAALRRFFAEGQRNVAATLDAFPESFESSNTGEAVAGAMRDLRAAVDALDHARIARRVHDVVLGLCRRLSGHDLPEDEALGFAFLHSARLGLGLWFADEVKSLSLDGVSAPTPRAAELLEIEAALGVYFLASYQEAPEAG
jgi:MFS family permease